MNSDVVNIHLRNLELRKLLLGPREYESEWKGGDRVETCRHILHATKRFAKRHKITYFHFAYKSIVKGFSKY